LLGAQGQGCSQETGRDTWKGEAEDQFPVESPFEQKNFPKIAGQVDQADKKEGDRQGNEHGHDWDHHRRSSESGCSSDAGGDQRQ
jgi:hypothetical protein